MEVKKLRKFVDGEADTIFEYCMLFVVIINTISLGLETVPSINSIFSRQLFLIDQVCLWIFIGELLLKVIAYNKEFFGEYRIEDDGQKYFHLNKWNIFDLLIIILSTIGSLPFFSVFRVLRLFKSFKMMKAIKSLRVVKTLKLVNGISSLRVMVKAIIKAFPSVLWTFFLLLIFAYIYAVMGTSLFGTDFPEFFGSLKLAFLSLFNYTKVSTAEIIAKYSWAWIYFFTYTFIDTSIIMNVIVGVIVDAVNDSQNEEDEENHIETVTLESLSKQIEELKKEIEKFQAK